MDLLLRETAMDKRWKTPPKNNSPLTWPYDVDDPLEGFGGMVFEQVGIVAGDAGEYDFVYRQLGHLRPFAFYVTDERSIFGQHNTLFALYGTFSARPLYFFRNLLSVCNNPLKQNAIVYLDWINAPETYFNRPQKSWKERAPPR